MTIELIQGSDEWKAARLAKVTASRIADLMAKTKTGYGASRANYMAELLCERLTGMPVEKYVTKAMADGIANEDEGRAAYEFAHDVIVETVGFVPHPSIAESGASPDGFVGANGLLEIKAPTVATHIETLISQEIPERYVGQMLWQMACTGRAWCDFVSFSPLMPDDMKLFTKRLHRDDAKIAEIEAEVVKFLAELDEKHRRLLAIYEAKAAA